MKKILVYLILALCVLSCVKTFAQPNGNFQSVRMTAGKDTATFSPQPNGTILYGNSAGLYFKTASYWKTIPLIKAGSFYWATTGSTSITTPTIVGNFTLTGNMGGVGNITRTGNLALTGVAGTNANNIDWTGIGTTITDGQGLYLRNKTAAAAGLQQNSPYLTFEGQGWKTNAVAASQIVKWVVYNQPVQSAVNPTNLLTFANSINGSAYTTYFTLSGTPGGIGATLVNSVFACNGLQGPTNVPMTFTQPWSSTTNTDVFRFIKASGAAYTPANGTLNEIAQSGSTYGNNTGTAIFNAYTNVNTVASVGQMTFFNTQPTITNAVNLTGYDWNPTTPTNATGVHLAFRATSGSVLIGGTTLTTNALFELQSTTKAFIPPKMTTAQRDAIGSPSAGMVVFNTTTGNLNQYNGAWYEITSTLSGSDATDLASIADGSCGTRNTTVTGAAVGDVVDIGLNIATPYTTAGIVVSAYVSSANTVTTQICNKSGAAFDPASMNIKIKVYK